MNFLIVCGGTAGHINPALAIAAQLHRKIPDSRVLFVGAGKELEKRLIPLAGFHLVNIRMGGLRRGFSPDDIKYNLNTARYLTTAGIKAEKLIRRFKPDAVIGTGGYICYPILRRASQMGIPTVIHGSDAVPGLTTKMLSSSVDKVLVSFPGLESLYKRPDRVVFTGTPVRSDFNETQAQGDGQAERNSSHGDSGTAPESGNKKENPEKPLVVSFWGSQGADRMNEIIAEFIKLDIHSRRFNHIHAIGKKGGISEIKNRLRKLGVRGKLPKSIDIREYIDDMPSVMASAQIVLCRAGASTLAELTVLGKPAILIPSPNVTNNHQEKNAREVEKAGGAVMLLENECSGESLYNVVIKLLDDKETMEKMSEAQKLMAVPDAAEKIVDIVLELCSAKREEKRIDKTR